MDFFKAETNCAPYKPNKYYSYYLQPASTVTTTQETTLPGISPYKNQAAPVKITNVQLQGAPTERHNWGQTVQYTTVEDAMGYQQDNIRGTFTCRMFRIYGMISVLPQTLLWMGPFNTLSYFSILRAAQQSELTCML